MKLGIDASNIRSGGGLTHLKGLLMSVDFEKFGIEKIVIWSCKATLDEIEEKLQIQVCPFSWPIGTGNQFKGVYNFQEKSILLFKKAR